MRRWALAWLLLIVVLAAPAIAQVQTIGDVSFAVPEGWSYQGSADGGLMLLKQEQNFWIVTVHAPRPTSGNPNADFKSTWQAVVSSVPQFSRSLPGYDPYSISTRQWVIRASTMTRIVTTDRCTSGFTRWKPAS